MIGVKPWMPNELEAAIKAAGARLEKYQNAGHTKKAREAFEEVKRLEALRTPETVERMEKQKASI